MGKITTITPEQTAQFSAWVKKWVDIGLSTEPADFDAATAAALRGYRFANLGKPMVVLRMASPYAATVGGAMAVHFLSRVSGSELKVPDGVDQQVWQQVRQQVDQQVWQQVGQQVEQQVRQQVGQQVRQQVRQQVWQQVDQQVRQQVEQQVWQQVWQQVEQQVGQQVRQQVWQQVDQQVRQQVEQQVWQQVVDDFYNYGINSLWAGWPAYVSFFRDVMGWDDPILEKFTVDETLVKSCGWTWWHENVLALSDRPRHIDRDERGRLHSETRQAIEYRDGWGFYCWHGMHLADDRTWIITHPERITAALIDAEQNAEIKRVMLERYTYERYLTETGAKVVHEAASDHPLKGARTARLLVKDIGEEEPICMVDALNSTPEPDGSVKRYMMLVDPKAYGGRAGREVEAALASTWRNQDGSLYFKRPEDYRPGFES